MRLSRPMLVWPSTTQCAPMLLPSPMRTCGPITAYGPTVTLSANSALASTRAVAWICVMGCSSRHLAHGAHQLGFDRRLAAHTGAGLVLVDAGLGALEAGLQDQLVARLDHALEAGAVDADEVPHRALVGLLAHRLEGQQRGGLRQRLEHQHTRHHRPVRKVAHEERLVDGDVFQRLDAQVLLELEHTIDQQDRIAVRQQLEDAVNVEHVSPSSDGYVGRSPEGMRAGWGRPGARPATSM